jgi:hypothetical protein
MYRATFGDFGGGWSSGESENVTSIFVPSSQGWSVAAIDSGGRGGAATVGEPDRNTKKAKAAGINPAARCARWTTPVFLIV